MAETAARWGTPPKHYKVQYRPLADFDYLWQAPHFRDRKDQVIRDKVNRRLAWEKVLPALTTKGDNREILGVFHSMLNNGMINPLPCIEQDGVLYPVKGNQRLCVLRAIRFLIDHRHLSKVELTTAQQQWVEKRFLGNAYDRIIGRYDLDAIPCRIASHEEHPGEWSHDHPVARNHIGDEVKVRG